MRAFAESGGCLAFEKPITGVPFLGPVLVTSSTENAIHLCNQRYLVVWVTSRRVILRPGQTQCKKWLKARDWVFQRCSPPTLATTLRFCAVWS
ncbi:hypothetical protein [Corynebacterium deserti]|uniref:hypothetical protein n=1 Tax=Corynebacterium deserti TaxID=1408191 RepID=UPI000A572F4B|nr:hypothetical protein [Corynebacterium deserti]